MADLKARFEEAAQRIRDESKTNAQLQALPNEKQLELYGLFKQGSSGDNTQANPGMFSMPATKAKWQAWEDRKGMSQDDAMNAYIELVEGLLA